jgi:hypothetical protein
MSAASVRTSGRRDNLPVFPIEAGNKGDCGSFSKPVALTRNVAKLQSFVDEGLLSKSLFENLDRENARLVEYTGRKETLAGAVLAARSRAEALYTPEALIDAIRSGDAGLRLKLKAEIARRVSRIDVRFGEVVMTAGRKGEGNTVSKETVAAITFVNGAKRWIYPALRPTRKYQRVSLYLSHLLI